MCPTVLGRVQTRWSILIIPAIIAGIVSLITNNPGWIVLIGVYFIIGVTLDITLYAWVISWQPPWLTFVLAVGEFVLLFIAVQPAVLHVTVTEVEAIVEYWVVWVLAIWTKVVILPLLSLSWIENAGEFRSTDWSVSPEYVPLAVTVFTPPSADSPVPALARQFSTLHKLPDELRNLPSPSGVHRVPRGA